MIYHLKLFIFSLSIHCIQFESKVFKLSPSLLHLFFKFFPVKSGTRAVLASAAKPVFIIIMRNYSLNIFALNRYEIKTKPEE